MDKQFKNYNLPDERGHFEKFGGKFVPESLIPALEELEHYYTTTPPLEAGDRKNMSEEARATRSSGKKTP